MIVERNVLEWRFDPASSARLPVATDHDLHVIVFCSEGYTSSLAAAALQSLGLWRDGHSWRISCVAGNGSADCAAKLGFGTSPVEEPYTQFRHFAGVDANTNLPANNVWITRGFISTFY